MSVVSVLTSPDGLGSNRIHWRTLTVVALLHGLAGYVLLSAKMVVQAYGLDRPLMVNLIELAPPATTSAVPLRPRPAVAAKPERQLPILATPAPNPAPVSASVPETTTKAEATAPAPVPAPTQAAEASTLAVLVPPRFDANYLNNPAPVYPPLSRRLGEQGRVLLRVYVEPDGVASRVEINSGSGFERLDHAALSAVRKWRFVPARQGSAAVGAWVVVPIHFSLRS